MVVCHEIARLRGVSRPHAKRTHRATARNRLRAVRKRPRRAGSRIRAREIVALII
jgi:hypothetical protein